MNEITTEEAAKKWGITARRVLKLAQEQRIPGAKRVGHQWMIPEDAEKPADIRTKAGKAKAAQEPELFRYPLFEYRDADSFTPPLNEEERRLKASAEAFYACRFEEADRLLGNLPEETTDRYRRITGLYYRCMFDTCLGNAERFLDSYSQLRSELEEKFPHWEEMKEYLYLLESTLGMDDYYKNRFCVVPGYAYHQSFLPHLAVLCAVTLLIPNEKCTRSDLNNAELHCILLEECGSYADLQFLHMALCTAYEMLGMKTESIFHFRKALDLAEQYDMYYNLAGQYYYIQRSLKPAFVGLPEGLAEKVTAISEDIHGRYIRFMDKLKLNSIYKLLGNKDFIFLYYAVQGLTNKEIATRLHTSVGTVGKQFGEIYTILGVSSKAEVVELYRQSTGAIVLKKRRKRQSPRSSSEATEAEPGNNPGTA